MNKKTIISFIIIILLLGVGYWLMSDKVPNTNNPTDTSESPIVPGDNSQPGDLSVEPAAALARKDLATKLSIDENSIVILQITDTTWTDGCLGLGGPAESCLQALVPGFEVEMLAKGETYFYRTDKTGGVIRAEIK